MYTLVCGSIRQEDLLRVNINYFRFTSKSDLAFWFAQSFQSVYYVYMKSSESKSDDEVLAGLVAEMIENGQVFDFPPTLGVHVEKIREKRNISRSVLATAVTGSGSPDFYRKLSRSDWQLRAETFAKIADHLQITYVSLYKLLQETEELDDESLDRFVR